MLSVRTDEDLVVMSRSSSSSSSSSSSITPIVKPLGIHFVRQSGVASVNELFTDIMSSGNKPPRNPPRTPSRDMRSSSSASSLSSSAVAVSDSQRYPHPGPLHLHSPGLSPIPAYLKDALADGGDSGGGGGDDDDVGDNFMEHSNPSRGSGMVEVGEDKQEEEEEEEEDGDYRLVSVHALDEEFQSDTFRSRLKPADRSAVSQDESLQAMSFLPSEDSQRLEGPRLTPYSQGVKGTVFKLTLDTQGSPVIIPLRQELNQLDRASGSRKQETVLYSARSTMSSRYWKERLHRRSLSSIMSSPQFHKFL